MTNNMNKKIIQISLLLITLLISNIAFAQQGPNPSYKQGFARSAGESAYPGLWRGLIGCWKPSLGNTGTTTLRDVSAYKNHGTMVSIASSDWVISGNPRMPGYALNFGGSEYITDSFPMQPQGTEPFTVSAWVKFTNSASGLEIINWFGTTTDDNAHFFYRQGSGKLESEFTNGRGANIGNTTLGAGVWYHVAATYNTAQDNQVYVNGKADTASPTNWTISLSGNAHKIGTYNTTPSLPFNGQIGEVLIWSRALNTAEILDLYQRPEAMAQLRQQLPFRVPDAAGGGSTQVIIISQFVNRLNNFVGCLYK